MSPEPAAQHHEFALPSLTERLAQIDLLKGLAILGVLSLHTLPTNWLAGGATVFYIGQAVPIFVVLMGLNATSGLWRQGLAGLGQLYSRRYVFGRLDRLYVPFLAAFVLSAAVSFLDGELTPLRIVACLVTGVLPAGGPGNYFITFAFQFAVIFPAYYWAYRRAPMCTTVAAFAVAAVFELAAPHVSAFDSTPYIYSAALLRFIPFFALGVVLAGRMLHGRGVPGWWWVGGAASVAYLVIVQLDADAFPLSDQDWRHWGQTFASAFYPALLVAAGLHWLPGEAGNLVWRTLARIGIASYEIFLVQIIWFDLLSGVSRPMILPSILICCVSGYAAHVALLRAPRLTDRFAR